MISRIRGDVPQSLKKFCTWGLEPPKIRGAFSGHTVAMVTYIVTKIITTCSPMTGQFFDTMIVASIDKEWL